MEVNEWCNEVWRYTACPQLCSSMRFVVRRKARSKLLAQGKLQNTATNWMKYTEFFWTLSGKLNIADAVLTFVVLSSDVTGVQCVPHVNLYVTVCSICQNKSSVSLFLDNAVYFSVPLGSKGCEPFGCSQMVETIRHSCSLNRLLCCHKCDSYMFRIDFH